MDRPPIQPRSYPDAGARNPDRKLGNLLRQKYYYYGGTTPNLAGEHAKAFNQTKYKSLVVSNLINLDKKLNANNEVEAAQKVLPNIFTLNPHVLAVALHIRATLRIEKRSEMETQRFKDDFFRIFNEDWNFLFTQLTKIQTRGSAKKTVSEKEQAEDVYRYIEMYVSFREISA